MALEELSYELVRTIPQWFPFSRRDGWEIALPLNDAELDAATYTPTVDVLLPLGKQFKPPGDFRRKLVGTTIVSFDRRYFLALSGAEKELRLEQWDVCETYLNLRYAPPTAVCRLPLIKGRGQSPRDLRIVEGCMAGVGYSMQCDQRLWGHLATYVPSAFVKPAGM